MLRSWSVLLVVATLSLPCALSQHGLGQTAITSFPKLNAQRDWPWWRGVTRDGHASQQVVPAELDETKNLDWSQPIPGRGHGSPIVVDDRIFMLTADEQLQIQYAIAVDRQTGKQLWQIELNRSGFPDKNHAKNTEATPTLASDGNSLFATLYHHDAVWLTALTLNGEQVWKKELGRYSPRMYQYGYAASPVLYGEYVIVSYEYDGPSALVALRRDNGQEVWRTTRGSMITFSSPVVTSHGGQDYLLISGANNVTAYDPATGEKLWSTQGTALATCGTMVWDQGIAIASGGFPGSETIALDMATGTPLWRNRVKAYEQSLIAADGYVYNYADGGVLYCWDAKTGTEMWKQRLTDRISASGVLVGDRIYWASEDGSLYVFKATPDKFIQLAKNKIGDEAFASPAICGGQIFLRVAKHEGDVRQEYLMRFSQR
ncbi:MAG: PQQ-binding-like beta-propeller repeat protein [Pirellulaceae bacterium]|nr:PQQ-binding-like beta-propeller repeat protein [Pirellulaceae bacterium]